MYKLYLGGSIYTCLVFKLLCTFYFVFIFIGICDKYHYLCTLREQTLNKTSIDLTAAVFTTVSVFAISIANSTLQI